MRGGFGAIWPVADLLGEEVWDEKGKEERQGKYTRCVETSRHGEEKSARHAGNLMSNDAADEEKMKIHEETTQA